LDGLDEVNANYRNDCVDAVNSFRKDHVTDLVVCSRLDDYEALISKLHLQGAIVLQALTLEQVDAYLKRFDNEMFSLRVLLTFDDDMQNVANTPLMLSIFMLAYRGTGFEPLKTIGTISGLRNHAFSSYIQRMFERRSANTRYTPEQTIHWLSWLARQVVEHKQSEFYIEGLQPDWLPSRISRFRCRVGFGLAFGLVYGLAGMLVYGLVGGLAVGLAGGLMSGLADMEIKLAETLTWRFDRNVLVGGLLGGLTIGLAGMLVYGLRGGLEGVLAGVLAFGLAGVLAFGLAGVLVVGLVVGFVTSEHVETRTAPNQGIRRSAQNAGRVGLAVGLAGVLAFGLAGELAIGLAGELADVLAIVLAVGLAFGLTLGGGEAVVKHVVLRIILRVLDYAPWNYTHFLDYCTERVFLQKVGGGYIFIHRLLMEYFAGLEGEAEEAGGK
jgi:hypothetical protein